MKSGQSLMCFMLRVVCSRAFAVLFVFKCSAVILIHNAGKVRQNTSTFPSSRSGMLTTTGTRKNKCITHRFSFHRASERGHSSTGEGLK